MSDSASFAAIKQAVIDRTGHHYYLDKDRLLGDRLARRQQATGCAGMPEYLALLAHPAEGAAEWRELEAEITIGETFFFRHAEQFAALETVILPEIIARKAAARRLRIWSAGCAVGAEPYSLAILLDRLLGEAIGDWSIELLGSDINHRCLETARAGIFGAWALRGMPDAERARNFHPAAEPKRWRIADRHARHLRFAEHNLLSLLDGPPTAPWEDFDLILCRNVLIYFSRDHVLPMMSALGRHLGPGGWLMLGHSDAITCLPPDLGIVDLPGTIAYRASGLPPGATPRMAPAIPAGGPAQPPQRAGPPQQAGPPPAVPSAPVARPSPAASRAETARPATAAEGAELAEPRLAAIRALADAGRLREAAQACAMALLSHPLDARLHFYDGVIAQADGQGRRAEAALRRATYLAGGMVMAHYHLGLLLLDGPVPEAGRRVMAQVVRLCASLPQTEPLAEGDGLTPRDLAERVEMRLRPAGSARLPGRDRAL